MRTWILCFYLTAATSLGLTRAGEEAPPDVAKLDIQFPVGPVLPKPPVQPPADLIRLKGDMEYVFDSNTPVLVVTSPEGVLSVMEEKGPLRIRGKFFDGGPLSENRIFQRKQVFVIAGMDGAEGKTAELLVVPVGLKLKSEIIRKKFAVGDVIPLPPKPKDDPKVDPPPKDDKLKPAPIPKEGFRVLIVYEAADLPKMSAKQQSILYSRKVWDFLDSVCVNGPDDRKEWRIWDTQVPGLENETEVWQAAMKRERKSLPWVIISNGVTGTEESLPGTVEEFITLVQKYKGK